MKIFAFIGYKSMNNINGKFGAFNGSTKKWLKRVFPEGEYKWPETFAILLKYIRYVIVRMLRNLFQLDIHPLGVVM